MTDNREPPPGSPYDEKKDQLMKMVAPDNPYKLDLYNHPSSSRTPPSSPADEGTGQNEDGLTCMFMGILREIRTHAQNLRVSLELIHAKEKLADQKTRVTELKSVLEEQRWVFDEDPGIIMNLLEQVRTEIFAKGPAGRCLYDQFGDEVIRIRNTWSRFGKLWEKVNQTPEEVLSRRQELDDLLCDIIFHANLVTIPKRVNQHLETLWPGQPLNFNETFDDELCRPEEGKKILQYLDNHPESIDGVVDSAEGIIYKVSPSLWRQALSSVLVIALVGFGLLLAQLSARALLAIRYPITIAIPNTTISNVSMTSVDLSALNPSDIGLLPTIFTLCFLFIVAGAVAHLLVEALKQQREGGSIMAVEGWFHWFHVHEVSNWAAVISLWVGFFGIIFILKTTDYATAFFVGYSIDSFVGLFLTRFSGIMTRKTAGIQETIPADPSKSTR